MLKWLKDMLHELKTDWPVDIGLNLIVDQVRDAIKGNIKKTLETNPRADVMRILAAMGNSPAAQAIFDRLRVAEETAEPGYENDLIISLGCILPRDKDGKVEEDKAKVLYEWVGGLKDDNFAVFVHGMQHDPYMQRIRLAWRDAKVGEKIDKAGEVVDDLLTAWQNSAARRGHRSTP